MRHMTYVQIQSESEREVAQSCPTLCDPMDSGLHEAPLSMGFSRQEYWSELPFPPAKHGIIALVLGGLFPGNP